MNSIFLMQRLIRIFLLIGRMIDYLSVCLDLASLYCCGWCFYRQNTGCSIVLARSVTGNIFEATCKSLRDAQSFKFKGFNFSKFYPWTCTKQNEAYTQKDLSILQKMLYWINSLLNGSKFRPHVYVMTDKILYRGTLMYFKWLITTHFVKESKLCFMGSYTKNASH